MSPFLFLEYSGSVEPLQATLLSGMHSHENEVCLRFAPDNLQALQSFLHRGKEIQSDIADDSTAGSSLDSDSNRWRIGWYGLFHIHVGHNSVCIQSGSAVEG